MGVLRYLGLDRGDSAGAIDERTIQDGGTSSLENPSTDLVQALTGLDAWGTFSGVPVSRESAMRSVAVYACWRIISSAIAMCPLPVYETQQDDSRQKIKDDPRWWLLNDEANPEQSSHDWLELMGVWLCQHGNAYNWLEGKTSGDGTVKAIWPLNPYTTYPVRTPSGQLGYRTVFYGTTEETILLPDEVLHLKGLTTDGTVGVSPIVHVARQAIALGQASEEFAARFFSQGATAGGTVSYPKPLTDTQWEEARKRWNSMHESTRRAHAIAVLDNGGSYTPTDLQLNELQFLEQRKFGVEEIARLYGVPPWMLAVTEPGAMSYRSVEHTNIAFAQYTVQPWLAKIERNLTRALFTPTERKAGRYCEFVPDVLLRGSTLERMQAYAVALQNHIMTPAEVRGKENLPYKDGTDEFLTPANILTKPNEPGGPGVKDSAASGGGVNDPSAGADADGPKST